MRYASYIHLLQIKTERRKLKNLVPQKSILQTWYHHISKRGSYTKDSFAIETLSENKCH